jgi:phosphoglycerate dehydrogenase-like enzyme
VCFLDDWDGVAGAHPAVQRLRGIADVVILSEADEEEVVAQAATAVAVVPIRERRPITAALLDRLPALRHIAQTGGAAAHIDVEAAQARGIGISLTPGASAPSVAELVICLLIAARRGVIAGHYLLQCGIWERPLGRELRRTTLGIVGAGRTGLAVAERATALGLQVLVSSRRATGSSFAGFPARPLDELCAASDAVSVHVELSPATVDLIRRPHLRAIGTDGLLVNTARAAIVNRDDLVAALDAGELGGAALDVFEAEPPDPADALARHPRVLTTPHLGWRTHETLERYLDGAVRNLFDFLGSNVTEAVR